MNIYIYIYVKLSHSAVYQKLTQHCKSTILKKKKQKKDNPGKSRGGKRSQFPSFPELNTFRMISF